MEYFEAPHPLGPERDGYCSDNACPCGYPGTRIARGTGYLYISEAAVDFRRDARTPLEVKAKIAHLTLQMAKMGTVLVLDMRATSSILICEQGARLRGLDLEVAAADARYWWETGLVPLRPTPVVAPYSKQFEGRSEEEAKAAAIAAVSSDRVYYMGVTQRVRKNSVVGEGKTADLAVETARARVPPGAFDASPGEITQEGQNGTVELRAYSEEEARRTWTADVRAPASLENLECVIAPTKGFLGMGKKHGLWRAHWSSPYRAEVSFKLPAVVTVRYT
jgi:hypothetical protein